MEKAKKGDRIRFEFTGCLDDGSIFDSTREVPVDEDEAGHIESCDDEECGCGHVGPMELVLGEGEFFPQVEEALIGMAPGEKKTLTILAADAFGDYDEERTMTIARADLPPEVDPQEGDELSLTGEDGEEFQVIVASVSPENITLDANHPLAGEDLTFELELLEIVQG